MTRYYTTKDTAERLAMQIREYWFSRGFVVKVYTTPISDQENTQNYIVRSDLVNGWPRTRQTEGEGA